MTRLATEALVIGSGAGGAVTAATLARSGRSVTLVEEGPWVTPGAAEPFSLDEMVHAYRHHGSSAMLGAPPIAYAEGRCVGGSTEINSGLWHRLPDELVEQWQARYDIEGFDGRTLDACADRIESALGVSLRPGPPPRSSAMLERGATRLGWRSTELARAFRYDTAGRGVKQTMARTWILGAVAAGATVLDQCRVTRLARTPDRVLGAQCQRRRDDGTVEDLTIDAEHVFVCGGAIQTPALLHRSGIRRGIGSGLKVHPTIKVAARFPEAVDHGDVPMHRVTEFAPHLSIGGSASRRAHVALTLADASPEHLDVLAAWEEMAVYYAAIRSEGRGWVVGVPGLAAPVVVYRLTEGDMSRLARGLVQLGELLFASGATELYPSVTGAPVARRPEELAAWWGALDRGRANLMTVHLTSTVRMGERRERTGADSYGSVWGYTNLRVNDASLVPDAPGVNPQAGVMTIALRNAEQFVATT